MFKLVSWLLIVLVLEVIVFVIGLGSIGLLIPISAFCWALWRFVPDDEWFIK